MANIVTLPQQQVGWYDSFVNLLAGLGVPGRDKFQSQQFVFQPLAPGECEIAYRGDWIARKCVQIPAWDMTREWRNWQADPDQITKLEELERKMQVQQKVQRAVLLARLYGGAAIIIGVDAGQPEEELDLDKVGQDSLKFIHVLSRNNITVGPIVYDITSPYFGLPEYYEARSSRSDIKTKETVPSSLKKFGQLQVKLHPSRVVRLIGMDAADQMLNDVWGDSVLQSVNDAVRACGLVSGSLATLISELKIDIINVPDLTNILSTEGGSKKMLSRFQAANAAKSVINTILLDKDETWQRVTATLAGVPEVLVAYMQVAAGAVDIPAGRFLGLPHRGLNVTGEADFRNYYDRLASEQKVTLMPAMSKLDEVIIRSALGDRPEELFYTWNSMWQMSDQEKSDMALKKAQAYQIDVMAAQLPPVALAHARANQLIEDGTYPGLEQALQDAEGEGDTIEEQNAPAPPPPMVPGVHPITGEPLDLNAPPGSKSSPAAGGGGGGPPPFGGKPFPPKKAGAKVLPFGKKSFPPKDGLSDDVKMSHLDVDYRNATSDERCSNCNMYDGAHCSLVVDPIFDDGVCDEFEAADGEDSGDSAARPFDANYEACHEPGGSPAGGQFVGCEGGAAGGTAGGKQGEGNNQHPGEGYSKKAYVDSNGVIQTTKVEDAQRALYENRRVNLDQPRKVSTLIKRLGRDTIAAVEQGKDAPNVNLCNVSVTGTNLFCSESKGILRVKMPQLDEVQTKALLKSLKKDGYKVTKDTEFASHLRATQDELSGVKVWQQVEKAKLNPERLQKRLVVSRDNYILDGHHHWAAKIALDAKDNKLTGKMRVTRVDISITDLLQRSKQFSGSGKSAAEQGPVKIHFKKKKRDSVPEISDGIFDLNDHYDANGDFYFDAADVDPCHVPGGSPEGGQFTGCEGGGGAQFGIAAGEVSRTSLTRKDVPDEDRWTLRRYIENNYAFKINAAMRGQIKDVKALKTGNDVLKAFDRHALPTKVDVTAFRGIKSDPFEKLKPGDRFIDNGFISTSANERWAKFMAKGGPLIEIQIPKGTKVLGGIAESQESELLLRPGSKFKVISRNKDKNHMVVRLQ